MPSAFALSLSKGDTEAMTPRTIRILMSLCAASVLALTGCGGAAATYPVETTPEQVARGAVVYAASCASCHGDATTRPPVATAPTHQADGHTWHHPDRLLVGWVLDGVPLAQVMPKFRGMLSEQDVRAVIAYIKTFWPGEVRLRQTEGSAEYEKQLQEDSR